jgi:hypothetical protein
MICLVIKPPGRHPRDPLDPHMALLPVDLQELLGALCAFPSVRRLSELGIYDTTRIESEWLTGLIDELSELLAALERGRVKLIVPDRVGVTFDEDVPMDFGLEGFMQWAIELLMLAQRAKSLGIPLLACGN